MTEPVERILSSSSKQAKSSVTTSTVPQRPNGLLRRQTTKTAMTGGKGQRSDLYRQKLWREHAGDIEFNWINEAFEEDMEVFRRACSDDPNEASDVPLEKIRAVSDFAPIKERVRRGPKRRRDIVREGWAYHVSRWPLLLIIFTVILLQFILYILVRQLVNVIEYFGNWRGKRAKLRRALRSSQNFEEWKSRALALDDHLRFNEWKRSAPNAYYDHQLIRGVLRALREFRQRQDYEGLMRVLHAALRSNFAGSESFRLYSETFYGTKELVQDYVDEVARSIEYLKDAPSEEVPLDVKQDFFRSSAKNLGASALCLSGGAGLGYYHFGVCRALLDTNTLPRVVTGTSAGAIVAAFICTRTDEELRELIVPELADRINACEEPFTTWFPRLWKTGARFEAAHWARKASFFTLGSMTFREAFERTGRVLNISVIPYDTHSPTKLLNYLTAPDCVIYSACIASAAVPTVMNPVALLQRDPKDGSIKPWEFGGKHKDGSLRVDIPLQALHLLFNVNFSIVSQVNPHIGLFSFSARGAPGRPVSHRRGKGWRGGFLLSAAEQYLKIELMKNFRVMRDLELLPELGGQNWNTLFLQKFEGTVTVWPRPRVWDWFTLLTDPDRTELARKIRVGQIVTFPRVKMIENRLKIERQIDAGRETILKQLHESGQLQQLNGTNGGGVTHHRDSSFDRLAVTNKIKDVAADLPEEAIADDEGEPIEELDDRELSRVHSRKSSSVENVKRRQEILAKLGLKDGEPASAKDNGKHGSSSFRDDHDDESDTGIRDHRTLRRRYSMGTLTRARPIKNKGSRRTMFGDATSSSDEDEGMFGGGGRNGGWSSAGSNQ